MSLLSYFPLPHVRERQGKVLTEIEDSIKSGYKTIFFEAPTGFGKSPVAVSLALYLGSSHFCTATKDLQMQYKRDFPFISEVTGRTNFPCIVKEDMGLSETCDFGPCVRDDAYHCSYKTRLADYKVIHAGTKQEQVTIDELAKRKYTLDLKAKSKLTADYEWVPCHYFHQKWIGARSSHTVYNYSYFLSDIFYATTAQKRNLLVLDEAHQLESVLGDFRSFRLSQSGLRHLRVKMPDAGSGIDDMDTWIDFCQQVVERIHDFIDRATGILERSNQRVQIEPYTERNLIDAIERESQLSMLIRDMKTDKNNWIVSGIVKDLDDKTTIQKATLIPLDVSRYFQPILEKGDVTLFMSATILSKEYLCKVTGLEDDKVKFIRIGESDIPIKNRPVYLKNVAWLNAKTLNDSMPAIASAINSIMHKHRDDKGIIHTTSYSQLNAIRGSLDKQNASRLIETGHSFDRREVLKKHFESQSPTVLISPSLHLGLDLKDDLSRFQIIVKVPYPDLTDRKISALKQKDPDWYTWHTVLRLIQTYGRSVRGPEDYASTYVLDSSISYLLKSADKMIPKWFSEAIVPATTTAMATKESG